MSTAAVRPPSFLATIGFLRLMLGVFTVLIVPLAWFASHEPEGWYVLPVYVAPVLAVLLFWGLLLDLIMARVFMAEKPAEGAARYRRVMRYDLVLVAILLLGWGPFFFRLVV